MARPKKTQEAEPAQAEDSLLIEMTKDGCSLSVHPSCVKAHQGAGWQIAKPAQNQE